MKNLLAKLQKHERSIAAIVFLIGILMIFFYVYAAVQYIDSETAELEQKLSAASYVGTGETYIADYTLDIRVDDKTKEEYLAMLDWSVEQDKYPVAIRVPSGDVVSTGQQDNTDYSDLNKFKVAHRGQKVAIIAAGNFFKLGEETQKEIKDKLGIDATLINPVYLTGVDTALLEDLKKNHDIVITLEDGCLDGGFGEIITRFYSTSDVKVLNYGAKKEFTDRVPLDELYQRYRLKKELITEDVKKLL